MQAVLVDVAIFIGACKISYMSRLVYAAHYKPIDHQYLTIGSCPEGASDMT